MTTEERIEALERTVQSLSEQGKIETKPLPEWPQDGDIYWCCNDGDVIRYNWESDEFDNKRKEFGNFFKTKQEAKNYRLRLLSMVNRWRPAEGESYYFWDAILDSVIVKETNFGKVFTIDYYAYQLGRCFKTEKEMIAHRDLYKAAWDALWEESND